VRRATLGILVALLLGGAVLLAQGPAGAQTPQQTYTLNWWTVDGGGTMSAANGGYALGGTAGQADPGVLTGGSYTVGGGFWRGGVPSSGPQYMIYLPAVFR
jgi:hypothetical protein